MLRFVPILIPSLLCVQQATSPDPPKDPVALQEPEVEFICPMDPDVRSKSPGFCPRCGMKLVPGIPDPHEYPVSIKTRPKVVKAGEEIQLEFRVEDPKTNKPVHEFEIVHEKLYHLFVVSQDLRFFLHTHPEIQPDSSFHLAMRFPHPGLYRVLSDFYPKGGTPQLMANTLMVAGVGFKLAPAKLEADLKPQRSENMDVELTMEPEQPIAGMKTLMFFRVKPNDGVEPYLGAMGHMLAASSDLIDMIHTHPFLVTDPAAAAYKQIQFNMIFPREGIYRVWVQFQRNGVVNTAAFNVPVSVLK